MKLGKLSESYYTAAQARKVLGVDEDTFQYWGKTGRITRKYIPPRKQALYPKREIDGLARGIELASIVEKPTGLEFKKASIDDLEEEYALARIIFGKNADTPEIRKGKQAFLEKNPDIDYYLYDNGNFVGCIHIVPLKHEVIMDFLQSRIGAWQIHPDNIEQFMPGKPLECLMIDALTTPGVEPIKRAGYASYMLNKLIQVLEDWGAKGVEISKIYGASRTPSGIRILKSAGFHLLETQENGKMTFELDVMNSNERVLKNYKEALEQWRRQQSTVKDTKPRSAKGAR